MPNEPDVTEEIFPKGNKKSYALVEMMRGKSPMVGKGPENTVFSFPVVLLIEIILGLGVTFTIFLFSIIKQAPLDEIANPMLTTDPAKAPWYFIGLQELLEHMHPLLAGILIPGILVAFLISLPYIDFSTKGSGVWFTSKKGKKIVGITALYTFLVMPLLILLDNTYTLRELLRDIVPQWVSQGLAPGGILMLVAFAPAILLKLKKATVREIILALFTVLFISAIVFTISGFLFRGPGFELYLPWEMPNGYNPWNDF